MKLKTITAIAITLTWVCIAFCGEIHDAAMHGDLERIKALLKDNPDLVFSKNDEGATALQLAALNGQKDAVELLLTQKSDPNIKTLQGVTPLMLASRRGDLAIVNILISARSDVNAKTKDGYTALMLASQNGYPELVRSLLDNGADVNAAANEGSTALFAALAVSSQDDRYLAVVQALINKGAKVNLKNSDDGTALMVASAQGNVKAVRALIAAGADVNAKTKNGSTPLMYAACRTGNLDVVQALLDGGADVNAKNSIGDTVLHVAKGNGDVADLLRRRGGQDISGDRVSLVKVLLDGRETSAKENLHFFDSSQTNSTIYGPVPSPSGGVKWVRIDGNVFVILEVQTTGVKRAVVRKNDQTWDVTLLGKGTTTGVAVPVTLIPCTLELSKDR